MNTKERLHFDGSRRAYCCLLLLPHFSFKQHFYSRMILRYVALQQHSAQKKKKKKKRHEYRTKTLGEERGLFVRHARRPFVVHHGGATNESRGGILHLSGMSNEDEVWQVAGRRRHRRPRGSELDTLQHQPELRRTNNRPGSHRHSANVHGKRKNKGKAHHGGYSYKATSTKQPALEQAVDVCREELVRRELAKLERLKALLRETALWQRLVEGLGSTVIQLGLAVPFGNEGAVTAAAAAAAAADSYGEVSPAAASDTDSMSASESRKADSPAGRRSRPTLRELVCYGVGNFTESDSSRYQLALALCLRDLLSVPSSASEVVAAGTSTAAACPAPEGAEGSAARGPAVLVFDPVMGETEIAVLQALGCGLLHNEEGKRSCCRCEEADSGGGVGGGVGEGSATPTLFFMPHCPQRLYSNVLWANWSSRGE